MLQYHFYTIQSLHKDGNVGTVTVKINSSHRVFEGHFPQQPVVPGVFALQMIKECVEKMSEKPLQYTKIQNCKFSNAIIPQEEQLLRIVCTFDTDDEQVRLKAVIEDDQTVFLSLKAILTYTG